MKLRQIWCLLQEQSRGAGRSWLMALVMNIAICLWGYSYYKRQESFTPRELENFAGAIIGAFHFTHILYVLHYPFAFSDDDALELSMPEYLMRLPMRTVEMVFWRFGFGIVSVVAKKSLL